MFLFPYVIDLSNQPLVASANRNSKAHKKSRTTIIGSPAIYKPNQINTFTEKIRDFPSQSYGWFGFLIYFIYV